MSDKRKIRQEKKELKRQGSKRRRKFLKNNLDATAEDFNFKKYKTEDFDER